ncbi:MAG: hypothetical protein H0T46_29960 [Deltaproteobacteria bacterium]|nr:hypothetical protein [Deltaproteobacteria bacterium]
MGEQRVESEGHFEMLWDCEHCGQKGLLGLSQRFCAECGGPQNPVKRYFPKEGDAKKVEGHKYEGGDRHCPACEKPMGTQCKNCTYCGAPMDGSKEVRGIVAAQPKVEPKKKRWWILFLVLGIIALVILGIWYRFIRTKSAERVVTAHKWTREIAVEEFKQVRESEWRDRVPREAEGSTCYRKERSRKQEKTGEETCTTERKDKKDGTFEQVKKCTPVYRSVPVEDDWCTYNMRKWVQIDTAKASGVGINPVWPDKGLPPADTHASFGAKRQGKKTETLTLEFGADDSCDVSDSTWRKYTDNQKVKVEVRASSGDVVCSSL